MTRVRGRYSGGCAEPRPRSPYHFIRRFEALFGTTPNQLRTRWRLDRAKSLLALGELSVTEVCMEVGFASLGSFSALFKARVGTTPSAYRRSARALIHVPAALQLEIAPGCLSLMGRLPPGAFRNFREARPAASVQTHPRSTIRQRC